MEMSFFQYIEAGISVINNFIDLYPYDSKTKRSGYQLSINKDLNLPVDIILITI